MLSCPRCLVVQCVRHRGDDVCCSVFVTLVGVCVFCVMWSELLLTSAISCTLLSSVYECQIVECAFTSPARIECGIFMITVCNVVCLCQLFCSAWMCCLEEVLICLSIHLLYISLCCSVVLVYPLP